MKYKKSLFIFRRDLRLHDNTALNHALEQSESVIPLFILDPQQVSAQNEYRSMNAIQFMMASLNELHDEIKKRGGTLSIVYGNNETVIKQLLERESIDALFCNQDYTPFAKKRDTKIAQLCKKYTVDFHSFHDYTLQPPENIATKSGGIYSVFTPFFKNAAQMSVRASQSKRTFNLYNKKLKGAENLDALCARICPTHNPLIHVQGARSEGLKLLHATKKLSNYKKTRDIPSMHTSNLSAHIKFGTVSIRECYETIKDNKNGMLLRQLYWRDFFTYVAFHNPFVFGKEYQEKYRNVWWSKDKKAFSAWCEGRTGFPIVDAGMRQLNQTGYMHNRARMIVSSFLTKDLHIDWRWGEKYFAQQLVDYDPCVNNGSWQWAASTGCDAQPYFRIFNPWLQQKKFDPDCKYIKQWVPELADVPAQDIHNWHTKHTLYEGYYPPMVDHATESKKAKELFKKALK